VSPPFLEVHMSWFEVDRKGMRQVNQRIVDRRGFGIMMGELYQNVMDTDATECFITTTNLEGRSRVEVVITDNGPGFARLSDAWTMFAPSMKKDDPTKAGRFNLGEKMVLSFCHSAQIETTSGTVEFNEDDDDRKLDVRRKYADGTRVTLELMCNQKQFDEMLDYIPTLIVREGLRLCVNGAEIHHREPIATWEETIPTEIGEDLRKSRRKTEVRIYEPEIGEVPMLYEMGIPVVETGDKWHVSVEQKVPLNTERDNVTPSFLKEVRVSVVNNMHEQLDEEDTQAAWVNEATSDKRCNDDASETFRIKKYGEKSVAFDPSNPEANAVAMSEGYTIIPSRGLTSGQRDNLKGAGTLSSSSQEFPTAGVGAYSDDPTSPPVEVLAEDDLTEAMVEVRQYSKVLGMELLGVAISVRFVRMKRFPGKPWIAAFGAKQLDFNVHKIGKKAFATKYAVGTENLDSLLIHEFGHHFESDHLSSKYHEALCNLGAKLKAVTLNQLQAAQKANDDGVSYEKVQK